MAAKINLQKSSELRPLLNLWTAVNKVDSSPNDSNSIELFRKAQYFECFILYFFSQFPSEFQELLSVGFLVVWEEIPSH